MEFLKELFGDKPLSYEDFVQAVNTYNGDEANKDKQIKIANLASGEYVGKGKHESELEKLNSMLTGKSTELESANNLIAELKKASKGNEDFQNKITGYESQVEQLQAELAETKMKNAIKVALLSEKAVDVDYLTFKLNEKLKEKGEALELDENDNIKGWDERLAGLKVQFPTMFESSTRKIIEQNKLPEEPNSGTGVSKEVFDKMGYQSRLKLKQEQPEVYAKMVGRE